MKINNKNTLLPIATTVLACSTSIHGAALIYEPFDDLDPSLSGNTPGIGLSGLWSGNAGIAGTSLSFGSLVTSGGHATAAGANFGKNSADPGTTLTGAGLMADGAELWFSALAVSLQPTGSSPNGTARTYIAIGNGSADGFDRVGSHADGRGFEIKLNAGNVQAFGWRGSGTFAGTAVPITDGTHLVVGRITWGAFGVADDTLELFLPDANLNMGSAVSTATHDFDQLGTVNSDDAFDTISFAGGHLANAIPEVDEIRFGGSYVDVTPAVPEPSTTALLGFGGLALIMRRRK